MRKRRRNKFVSWALIVALLHLALVMAPATTVLAAPSAATVQRVSAMDQALTEASPCHEMAAAMPDRGQPEDGTCPECSCLDHCPWCAQLAAGLPLQGLDLIPLRESFAQTQSPQLTGLTHSLAPPPPR